MIQIDLSDKNLKKFEKEALNKLLLRQDKSLSNDLEQMWHLVDLVWEDYGCDNKNPNWDLIGEFYADPVWLLNGLFIEQHRESMDHRNTVSNWIAEKKFNKIVDYGGGFGALARLIAENNYEINIDIYEPYPCEFGIKRASEFQNINIIGTSCFLN